MASVTSTGASSRQFAALKLLRRRLIQAVPLILGVVVINFCLIQLAPGSFLDLMTAENQVSDPATVELLRKTYGLDAPVWLQLVKYIWALLQLDFGFSYRQNMPVIDAIWVATWSPNPGGALSPVPTAVPPMANLSRPRVTCSTSAIASSRAPA